MTSDGPYPPGWQPAEGAAQSGRPAQEGWPPTAPPAPGVYGPPPGGPAPGAPPPGSSGPGDPPPASAGRASVPSGPPAPTSPAWNPPGPAGPAGPTPYGAPPGTYGSPPGGYGTGPGVYGGDPGAPVPVAPPPARNRRGLIIGLSIGAVALVVLAAVGITLLLSSGSNSYPVGSCVKQSGDKAEKVDCAATGAYSIVAKVDKQSACPDPNQPFVVLHRSGTPNQVLCLKPAH